MYRENENFDNSSVHWIFRINGMYYSLIGTLLVVICGYVISIATGGNENLDPKLLSPLIRRFYEPKVEKIVNGVTYVECGIDEIEKVKNVNGEKVENGKFNILNIKANEEGFQKTKS
jgi:hypothetical protein